MTLQLAGRLQTRLVTTPAVGGLWALAVTPLLPRPLVAGRPLPLGRMYAMTLAGLGVVTVAGLAWEAVYHGLQQLRWDKDWPSLFALLGGIPEGFTTWMLLHAAGLVPGPVGPSSPVLGVFAGFFASTWLAVWLFLQGPVRVLAPRRRYRGGRFF